MATIWDDIKGEFNRGNAIIKFIMLNIAIYILVNLLVLPFYLSGHSNSAYFEFIQEWFYLPPKLSKLIVRPWTLITYMFLHKDFWHILFNMLILYWFGRIANDFLPNHRVRPIYLLGGLAGGLVFIIAYNVFPVFQNQLDGPLVGASASVMAVVLAATTLNPRGQMRFFLIGSIELQYIALFFIILDILSIPFTNPGGHFAHLGGALMGWFYVYQLRRGNDLGQPFIQFGEFVQAIFQGDSKSKRKKRQPRMVYKKAHQETGPGHSSDTQGFSRTFAQTYRNMSTEECVDAILDKIRKSGYDSLSEDEKAFLDKSSKDKK